MPRNRSEKLPRSPEAHAYAHASEYWLRANVRGELGLLWRKLGNGVTGQILDACGRLTEARDEVKWRRDVIAFIRKSYAT